MVRLRMLPKLDAIVVAERADAGEGEVVVVLGVVWTLAACTSATLSERAILVRGGLEDGDGEGSDLVGATALLHCARTEGGPGSFDVVVRVRMDADVDVGAFARKGAIAVVEAELRMIGPKSLIALPSGT